MKKKLILLLILIFLFGAFIVIKYYILDANNTFGKLKVISSPTTSIFIDNVPAGRTPFEDTHKVGEYILKLIPEGTATDTASWQGTVKIYKNALTYVNRELGASDITSAGDILTVTKMDAKPDNPNEGEVYVETEPNGAIVYLDNDEKGVATLILQKVQKGEHELSVSMPRFFKRTQKIKVDPNYRVNASFKLAIDQSQLTPASPEGKLNDQNKASESASTKKTFVTIKETPTGWLRVRFEPTLNASEAAKVNPGKKFELLEEKDGWYKIEYDQKKEGWISGQYAEKSTQ